MSVIALEEELAMQEATLQNLVRRQQALNVDEARRQGQTHVDRLDALQSRRETLQETRQKHLDLQQEIQEALDKSKERLSRVVAASAQQDDEDEDSNAAPTAEEGVEEAIVAEGIMEENDINDTEQAGEGRVEIPVPNLHLNEEIMADFWKTHGDSGLAVFLPCLNSADLIQRIMNVTALETLALDHSQPEGNHRQESLWKTCLDFLCTASQQIQPKDDVGAAEKEESTENSSSGQESDAVIDPNVALCPYELTGECADPFCPYQHIKPRSNISAQILARERLPLPTLKLPDTPTSANADHSIPVQEETDFSPEPSPLRKRQRRDNDDEASVQTQTLPKDDNGSVQEQTLSNNEESELEDNASAEEDNNSEVERDDDGPVSMEWNDDFVSLPPASKAFEDAEQDGSSSSSTGSAEKENVDHDVTKVENHIEMPLQELWWHTDEDVARMNEARAKLSTLRLSLTNWLDVVGGFQVVEPTDGNSARSLVSTCSGHEASPVGVLAVVGRVVDCVRLCVHAGRFELTHSLCEYAQMSVNSVIAGTGNMDHSKDVEERETIGAFLGKIVQYLEKARDMAFHFNSDYRNVLCCAFEAEISMAVLQTFMILFYERISVHTNIGADAAWVCEQSTLLDKAFSLLSPASFRSRAVQAVPRTPTNVKELLKELEVLARVDTTNNKGLESTVDAIQRGQRIMDSLQQCPMEVFVDEVLKPALSEIRQFAEKRKEEAPGVHCAPALYTQGYIILGCAQSACAQILAGGGQGLDASATLTTIDSCIYQIVTCLANISSTHPLTELFLAPLYALSVSLASTLRRYGKAQRRLEAALNVVLAKGSSALHGGYLIYSELLWSQLIQLRSSLPLLHDSASLSVAIKSEHRSISATVAAFGVHPTHVTLCGDWNMLKAFDVDSRRHAAMAHVRKYCHGLFTTLFSRQAKSQNSLFCNLWHLPLTEVCMPTRRPSVPSLAFPRSTLLAGRYFSVLVANQCNLKQLPNTFGMYFVNLKVLKLAENDLTKLVDSIGKLRSLADFDISHNRLQSLPSTIGSLKKLVRLDACHNELSSLPAAIVKCKSLEEVILSDNPIRRRDVPQDLTLRCSSLYSLSVDDDDDDEGT